MLPPKYQRIPEHDLEAQSTGPDNAEEDLLTYPPGNTAVIRGVPLPEGDRPNVIYSFTPRFPMIGEASDALGVLGLNREETTQIVQRGFPLLASYPAERIEFLTPVKINTEGDVVDDRWAVVMDEAWSRFKNDPPPRLCVRLADSPGDAEARAEQLAKKQRQENIGSACGVLLLILLIGGFFAFIFLMVSLGHKHRSK